MSYWALQASFVFEISQGVLACLRPEEARKRGVINATVKVNVVPHGVS